MTDIGENCAGTAVELAAVGGGASELPAGATDAGEEAGAGEVPATLDVVDGLVAEPDGAEAAAAGVR